MNQAAKHNVTNTAKLWLAAFLAGILGALAMDSFHLLIDGVEWLLTRHTGSLVHNALSLPMWARILVPLAGGVLAGAVLQWGAGWISGPHVDYIEAARSGQTRLNDRSNAIRMLSSLFSVGSGAAIGREGPMVQLSAWFASWLGGIFPLPDNQRNAVLVCGIAAGIAAAYHAPVAGVVFVLELALGFFARHTVAPVLISATMASALIFWMVEPSPLYVMPVLPPLPVTPLGLLDALAAGVISGLLGLVLLAAIKRSKAVFSVVGPLWMRLGAGGLVVGLLSAFVPEVWGNGYSVVSQVLHGGLAWRWVAVVLVAKVLATIASTSSGAIGGIFTPSLFVGATIGYLFGTLTGDPVVMAVICMGAVLSAVTHAPMMAIVMVLEMTSQFDLTIPVMLACAVAYAVSTHFGAEPLYGNPIEHHE